MSEFEFGNLYDENNNFFPYGINEPYFPSYFEDPRQIIEEPKESNDFYNNSLIDFYDNNAKLESLYEKNNNIKNIVTVGKTESTSFLTNKRERDLLEDNKLKKEDENDNLSHDIFYNNEKEEEKEKETEENIEQLNIGNIVDNKILINLDENKPGRRKEDGIYYESAKHTKDNEDNIMRKIKTFVFQYILRLLNDSLIDKNKEFYPLETELNENLKKDLNVQLLNRTILDIYENSKLNDRHKFRGAANKILIKKILEENVEIKTIKILSMTYKDILDQIREKDSSFFLEEIRKKESRKKKNTPEIINSYLKKLEDLLFSYENWFGSKLGRNSEKRKKKSIF
jgi:hypothetical protein